MTPDWQKIRELEEMLEAREAVLKSCHLTITVLHSRIRDLEAQLKGQTVGAWIACSERMPSTCAPVYVHVVRIRHVVVATRVIVEDGGVSDGWGGADGAWYDDDEITHWMIAEPLPAPPVQPKGDE